MTLLRRVAVGAVTVVLGLSLTGPTGLAFGDPAPAPSSSTLTNLAHLDFLTARVEVPATAEHTTYRLATEKAVGVLWVYADARPGGTFERVGGGKLDPATNSYEQGAYDADDIARAAVVYLRQWRATGDSAAKEQAYQQLRGLTYLQTLTGPSAGEVVLWMQPDGRLNPSPIPVELPDPSDSGESYWLARTIWALGEGYAAFRQSDREFAGFLRARMDLAIAALNRDVLTRYGTYQVIHGVKVPDWLIVDGADASSEAVLGLAAYVQATGDRTARTALRQLARGIAELSAGSVTSWPYRALLPWGLSRSDWHAWGANMPAALATASKVLGDRNLLRAGTADSAGFSPQLLTSTGPVNGLLPTPIDATQIAYGADARVQGLLAVGVAGNRPGIRTLAGIAAGWFFGQNAAGVPVYDPATGVTQDGVQPDGTVNPNSGAESTIHGLLTMQLLDANPDLAAMAGASASIRVRDGLQVIEAESGTLSGGATVTTADPAWTGESQWSGGQYVSATAGSMVTWSLAGSSQPRLVQPVVGLISGSKARTAFRAGQSRLGSVRYGAVGPQGNAPAPIELVPIELRTLVGANPVTVSAQTAGGVGAIDALLVMPEVATLLTDGGGHFTALLTSKSRTAEQRTVAIGGSGTATVRSYDRSGVLLVRQTREGSDVRIPVAAGGFSIVTR